MTLSTYIQEGGPFVWVLLALTAAALVLLIERFLALGRVRGNANDLLSDLRKALVNNRSIGEAVRVCEQRGGPLPSVLKAGLLKYGEPRDEVDAALANAALHEEGRLRRGLPLLAAIGAVAPLLGFLGTVIRLSHSPGALSGDVMAELAPTAAGLLLAIPVRFAYPFFSNRVEKFGRDVQAARGVLVETLDEMERGPAGAPAGRNR